MGKTEVYWSFRNTSALLLIFFFFPLMIYYIYKLRSLDDTENFSGHISATKDRRKSYKRQVRSHREREQIHILLLRFLVVLVVLPSSQVH